jgi:mannosyltransferase
VLQQFPSTGRGGNRQGLWWLSLLFGVALALRLYRLGQNSLWVDEFASLVTARHPLSEIPGAALRGDAFEPPFYFWLLHITISSGGESESALRLLSAVAGALTVPLLIYLIRELTHSGEAAALSAGLLAISPLHLWYSQEARPYALLVCLGTGALLCLVRAARTNSLLAWAGFTVLAALTVLTHIFGLVIPLVGWIWIMTERRSPLVLRPLFAASLGIALLTTPFVYRLAQAVLHAESTGSPPRPLTGLEIPYTFFTYVGGYSLGPSVREIQNLGAAEALRGHWEQSALGMLLLVMLTALMLRLREAAARNLLILLLLPMMVAWTGAALTGKAYNVRYALPGLVGFLGLAGLSLSRLGNPRRWALTTLSAGVFLWADAQWFYNNRYWKEDSRSAVTWLGDTLPAGATVAVAPGYQTGVLDYYARRGAVDLAFQPLTDTSRYLEPPLPGALLLTRLHHVPHWRDLVRSFEDGTGATLSFELVGYRGFVRRQ